MGSISIIASIDEAVSQINNYVLKYKLPNDHILVKDFIKVLSLLKNEFLLGTGVVNERLLRGFKDICATTAIQYEDTFFNNPIFDINDKLKKEVKNYDDLELLRMDFGKGDPI